MRKAITSRNAQIATIKIAVKQIGMDDDVYRDMLWAIARVRSAADLDWAGRKKVIDHLKARGAVIQRSGEWSFIDAAAHQNQPLLRKICAVCRDMGVGKAYAEGIARRQHGVDRRLEMMSNGELWVLVGALEHTRKVKRREESSAQQVPHE